MSLDIDTRTIVGIYALNQWFKVKPFSVWIDAYDLCEVSPNLSFSETEMGLPGHGQITVYNMSELYRDFKDRPCMIERRSEDEARFEHPSSSHGISGILDNDSKIQEEIYFSLLEVKAFKCISQKDAEKLCPLQHKTHK
tara:strand:+ start:43 stop:459 length:417 start_codon:yes stop_codon:yes gene_type:complete